ncbi:trehalose-phosphatase, partial [Nosema bombycis CQ1]
MLGDGFKKEDNDKKASKILVEFEEPTDKLHIYSKPKYMVKDFSEEPDTYYIGIFNTDDSVLDEDYEDIKEFCAGKNIIPIFGNKPALGKVIKDTLEGFTFRQVFSGDQLEMWKEYVEFNQKIGEKLKENNCEASDIIWIQDHNCFLVPEFIDNKNIVVSFNLPFTSLAVGIPYYRCIMKNLVRCKAISFYDSCSKTTFDEFVAPFTFETKKSPITTIHSTGTNVDLLDEIIVSQEYKSCDLFDNVENLLVLPYNSTDHLLSIEAYLSKYDMPINVLLLNIGESDLETQVGVQRLSTSLANTHRVNISSFLPRDDIELCKVISNSLIGFIKSLKGYFYYFNKHFIGDSTCDYEFVADQIAAIIKNPDDVPKKYIEPGKAKRSLTTPSCIRERMLSFALPQTLIDYDQSETINLSPSSSTSTLSDKSDNMFPAKLMDIKEVVGFLNDEASTSTNKSFLNRSRIIQVTSVDPRNEMGLKPIETLIQKAQNANKIVLLLDYDGTLTPIVLNPDDAVPSDRLLEILEKLNQKKKIKVRSKGEWNQIGEVSSDTELPFKLAQFYFERTPGSHLEKKSNGFVFHYRNCPLDIGEKQAMSLYEQLKRIDPKKARLGKMIVEFRSGGKDEVLKYVKGDLIIAAGDDTTDEDMFKHKDVFSIKVGLGKSKAQYYVEDVDEMIHFLDLLSKSV